MEKKINFGKKLFLTKEKLNQLNKEQLNHFLGGRMAAGTSYTVCQGGCTSPLTVCCSQQPTACCGTQTA